MNDRNPNINITFEDGFNIDINEEEILKNIDYSLFDKDSNTNNNNNIQNTNSLIPASELLKNQEPNFYKSKENQSKNEVNQNIDLHSDQNSSKMTNMNMPCVYTGEKGGMKGINHEKIEKIIYETTKNSRIFKKNEEDLAYLKQEVLALE